MEAFMRFWAIQVSPLAIYWVYKRGLGPKMGLNELIFASLAQFNPVLLLKSRILVYFPVELICGSVWEIWAVQVTPLEIYGVYKWVPGPKLGLNGLIWLFWPNLNQVYASKVEFKYLFCSHPFIEALVDFELAQSLRWPFKGFISGLRIQNLG